MITLTRRRFDIDDNKKGDNKNKNIINRLYYNSRKMIDEINCQDVDELID